MGRQLQYFFEGFTVMFKDIMEYVMLTHVNPNMKRRVIKGFG